MVEPCWSPTGWGFGTCWFVPIFPIWWMSSSQLTNSNLFQRGRLNHQPAYAFNHEVLGCSEQCTRPTSQPWDLGWAPEHPWRWPWHRCGPPAARGTQRGGAWHEVCPASVKFIWFHMCTYIYVYVYIYMYIYTYVYQSCLIFLHIYIYYDTYIYIIYHVWSKANRSTFFTTPRNKSL